MLAYLGRRMVADIRRGQPSVSMAFLLITMMALFVATLFSWIRAGMVAEYQYHSLPWISPWLAIAIFALAQFAYRFPVAIGGPVERAVATALLWGYVLVETAVAFARALAAAQGDVQYRSSHLDLFLLAALCWLLVVLVRQRLSARGTVHAAAARGFLGIGLMMMAQCLTLTLRSYALLADSIAELINCWLFLGQIAGMALTYLNTMPERSSFMVKLSGISVTMLLVLVVGLSWLVSPVINDSYRDPDMVRAGDAYRFEPTAEGGYRVMAIPFAPEAEYGEWVGADGTALPLPFAFPFYGKEYREYYPSIDGIIGFDVQPSWRRSLATRGYQPQIFVLMAAMMEGGTRLDWIDVGFAVRSEPDRILLSWRNVPARIEGSGRYSAQMWLFADGAIEIHYLEMPHHLPREIYSNQVPWEIGIMPGVVGADARLSLGSIGAGVEGPPGTGLIQDYQRDFLEYVDRFYAPIAVFTVLAAFLVVVLLPAFLRFNLVAPLADLLKGVQRFRGGALETSVPVHFRDEIGFLSSSFNAMAEAQHDLVQTLEQRVAERSEQLSRLAARNAQLEERDRLSGDLHDSVSQTLFSAAMLADILPDQVRSDPQAGEATLARIGRLNRHAIEEMRMLLNELRSSNLAEHPVAGLIAELAARVGAEEGLAIDFSGADNMTVLPVAVQTMFYRTVQESLNNIVKHARASHVDIRFEADEWHAALRVRDDGVGFDPGGKGGERFGLQIMRDRARRLGARLEVRSRAGEGSEIELHWEADGAE